MRNPLANIAASPKENLMVRPVAANVVRISVDQMPLLLRRLEGVLAKERLYAQPPHVRSQKMSGPSSDAARGPLDPNRTSRGCPLLRFHIGYFPPEIEKRGRRP